VKRTTTGKLKLKAETIRALDARCLERIQGGGDDCYTGTCPTAQQKKTRNC
jgi:hypothetical protein